MKNETIGKILRYIKQYRIYLILSLVFAAISVALTLYVPILIGHAIDCIVGKDAVDFAEIGRLFLQILIAVLLTGICQWMMNICNNKITYQIVNDIRRDAFHKIQKLPLKYIDSHPYGEVVSKMITDVDQFADGLLMGFTQLFTGVITIIGTLLFMLFMNAKITLVVVVITPLSLLVARYVAKNTYDMFQLQSEKRAEQTAFVDEMLGNLKVVKAYGHEAENMEKFCEINEDLKHASLRATFFSSITNPSTRFVNNIVYAGVGLTGAIAVVSGVMTVGQLTSFLSYSNQYTKPFNEISGVLTEVQNALACAARIFDFIEEESQVEEVPDAKILEDAQGKVDICDVSFSYEEGKTLIEDLKLHVAPGQRIAIVGPTGCGKTTFINLLMRFYDVNCGHILIDDNRIVEMTRHSLRKSFGMVLQETWLKEGTIRENIAFGKPDATDEEVIEAAKAAYAHSFIKRLPQGYDTVIGEEGGSLSQGQKQLLCIARIMLCLPPMLILDEATSSIDTRTEQKIQNAFAKLMQGRTSFIVAHRLSTIKEADHILVMKDGHIIEQGTHEELLAKQGFYQNLYESQFAK